ncbi:MAG: sigma-70 family RNA polymerase sigma factor [Myxococcota bacterium]
MIDLDDVIGRARQGDKAALAELLASEEARIYAFGLRMCRDPEEAKETLQDTMLAVASHISSFRGESSLSTWLFQLARSACAKRHRRKSGAPDSLEALDDVAVADPAPSPERAAEDREVAERVHRALAALPDTMREVVVLRDVEGLTAPEVAEVMGLTIEAVKSRLHRGRAALRAALGAPDGERAADGECPDIVAMYSRQLEGDLSSSICAQLEQHVARCPRCRGQCEGLKLSLAQCRALPVVPVEIQRDVRQALADFLHLR